MIKSFSLKNFRVFREKTTFNFRPITILTGPNSSGKSSLSNALYLMHKTLGNKQFTDLYSVPYELKTSAEGIHLGDIDKFRSFGSGGENITFGFAYDSLLRGFVYSREKYIETTPGGILIPLCSNMRVEFMYSQFGEGDIPFQIKRPDEFLHKGYLKTYAVYHEDKVLYKGKLPGASFIAEELLELSVNYQCVADILIENLAHYIDNYKAGIQHFGRIPSSFYYGIGDYPIQAYNRKLVEDFLNCISGLIRISENIENLDFIKINIFRNEGLEIIADLWDQLKSKEMVTKEVQWICKHVNIGEGFTIEQAVDSIIEYILSHKGKYETSKEYLGMFHDIVFQGIDLHNMDLFSAIINNNQSNDDELHRFILVHYYISILFPNSYNFVKLLNFYIPILYYGIMDLFTENLMQIDFFNSNAPIKHRMIRANDNNSFVQLLRRYLYDLEEIRANNMEPDSEFYRGLMGPEQFVNYWIKQLGIGKAFNMKYISDSESIKVEVVTEDGSIMSLLDLGAGIRQIIFMLLAVCRNSGLSRTILLEEPENNLHPAYQSKLADIFVHAYNRSNNLIIETHSEYLIRKLQYLVAKGECKPEHVVIYYIDHPDPAKRAPGAPQVREITLDKNGRMSHDFGPGFFDEADNLAIQLFNFNQQNPN